MAEQINLDRVVTDIMMGLTNIIDEQDRLNEAKMVLYMALHNVQLYQEETALSTCVDSSAEWVRMYIASLIVRGCTERTVEAYTQEFKLFFGMLNKSVAEVTTGDLRGYLAHCKLVRKNSDVTINTKTRILRGLFRWLAEEEYIVKDPMVKIKDNKVEHRVKDVFTDEQVAVIKDTAFNVGIRDLAIVDFLHRTGVRISEMVSLNRDAVDLQERQCIVYGKGRKERPVYFNGEAAVHLREYLESRDDDNPALFVGSRKPYKRMSKDGVRVMLRTICDNDDRLRGVAVNPHKWRRQFVTELLEKDVPLTLVADLVGHKNLNTTKDNYGNYSKNKARDAHRKYIA